jgi:hypothetical protein
VTRTRTKSEHRSTDIHNTKQKGKLVEQIVATMHSAPGVKVEQNVHLPARGVSKRTREIDVLLTSDVAGYPIRLAFECKNYAATIDAPRIDEFVGKLADVGIPPQCGIYVTSSQFTSGAIERAAKEGIRLLMLTGLTRDRITAAVNDAIQSIVFLLAAIKQMRVQSNVAQATGNELLLFHNEDGEICGSVPDLIWKKWIEGDPHSVLGDHEVELTIPQDWCQLINGKIEPVLALSATVHVVGYVLTLPGRVQQHQLVDVANKTVDRFRVNVQFDPPSGKYPIVAFNEERELEDFLKKQSTTAHITIGRIRLPRILLGNLYWPPSKRVASILTILTQAHKAGEITNLSPELLADIEGDDLETMWEPIWPEIPILKSISNEKQTS